MEAFRVYDPLSSAKLKDENRDARLCQGVSVERIEVCIAERD
jgi:hypothetical protein